MTTNPRQSNGHRRRQIVKRVRARDELCWLCHQPVDKTLPSGLPGSPEVHEVIPVSRGGSPTSLSNTVLCHRSCNAWIGARTPDELSNRSRRVAPSPVSTSRAW